MSNEKSKEIINVRVFDVPREVLFNAWENPALLAQWWGPKGFRNTFHKFDFRPEGSWKFTMHAPDGTEFKNENIFEIIDKPTSIVFRHVEPVHTFRVTVTFDEQQGKTKLTFRQVFDTDEEYKRVKGIVTEANEQNFDRLEAVISKNLLKK